MNWILCWFGIHWWSKAPTFAGVVRRECHRCGLSQAHNAEIGWIVETSDLRRLVQQGLALKNQSREHP